MSQNEVLPKIFFTEFDELNYFYFSQMNSEQQIIEKLDLIISLLTKTDSHKERKPRKSLLNLSKFVNEEQRGQILNFIQQPNTVFEITRLPSHKQIAALQKMIDNEFGIKLSYYMSSKLVDTILQDNTVNENSLTKSDKQSSSEEADSSNEMLSE